MLQMHHSRLDEDRSGNVSCADRDRQVQQLFWIISKTSKLGLFLDSANLIEYLKSTSHQLAFQVCSEVMFHSGCQEHMQLSETCLSDITNDATAVLHQQPTNYHMSL